MLQKYTSRKFLLAVAGLIAAIAHGNIVAIASIVGGYLATEGIVDHKSIEKVVRVVNDGAGQAVDATGQLLDHDWDDGDDEDYSEVTVASCAPTAVVGFAGTQRIKA